MIKSCVSTDGQYLLSGSEDGIPYIWNTQTHDTYRTKKYECKFLDLVSDIDWNPKYNMFALCGFGHQFPIMIYVYQRSEEELNQILYSGAGIPMTEQAARVSEGKSAVGGITSHRRPSMGRIGKENDTRGSTELRNSFQRNFENVNNYIIIIFLEQGLG